MKKGSKYILDLMNDGPYRYERHRTRRSVEAQKKLYDREWPEQEPCVIYVRVSKYVRQDGDK